MITFSGIEWDYNNLSGIGYDSETLLEPYATWFYQITGALNFESETINLGLTDDDKYASIYHSKDNIIKINDYSKRKFKRIVGDSLAISDVYNRKVGHHNVENINFYDFRVSHLNNNVSEDIVYLLDEARSRYIKTGEAEVVIDQVELSGSACLFDFEAKDGVWSESDFNDWTENDSPVNYNELRPFIPGEYEYTDAYIGFRLTIPPTSGRYGVAHSTVYIDVEDTVEKGTTEALGGALTEVSFSKRFYTSPHIMTSLNYSQEQCYIEVSQVSRDGFKFGLKSTVSGQYLAGEINWLADGY